MVRPYIICHMVTSLDGKVTGDFLSSPLSEKAIEIYYDLNRKLKCDGFICGRVTMEGSFTGGFYPDLDGYEECEKTDFIPDDLSDFYAVAFDTNGRLGWKDNKIADPDGDVGYDKARIIEVLSEDIDRRYLGYLRAKNIPYVFAGEKRIDVEVALEKLREKLHIATLLLEGGSIINGAFERVGAVDEISLVVAPIVGDKEDKPLFFDSKAEGFKLTESKAIDGVIITRYKRI